MKKVWIYLGAFAVILAAIGVWGVNKAQQIKYKPDGYTIKYLDSESLTVTIHYEISNPFDTDIQVFAQEYDLFLANKRVSTIASPLNYLIGRKTKSIVPIDVTFNFKEIESKFPELQWIMTNSNVYNLPVFIRGKLSAKIGIIRLGRIPVYVNYTLGELLP